VIGKLRNHIDHWTLYPVIFLMLMSLSIVYSASAYFAQTRFQGDSERLLISHAIKVVLALAALLVGMRIDYHIVRRFSKQALMIIVGVLFLTLVIGLAAKGATRWLDFGLFGFQPSELAKYALLFHLCVLISAKGEAIHDFKRGFLPMMIWVGIVSLLVLLQPNFSMGAMIFLLSMVVVFLGRAKLSHLALTLGSLVPALIGYMLLAPYRMKRIIDYLSGTAGDGSPGYQLLQALHAFANGGIFGVGPGESRQRDMFLPESYGDFIYAIIGEEWGFIGTAVVMLIFLWILYRGFKISRFAEDELGRMLALAITLAIVTYGLINACVTLGLLPTTGLPMTFISYGGTSMIMSAFSIGLLLNISSQTEMHPRIRQVPVVGTVRADDASIGKVY
jgi:cell division protein FtsW